MIVLNESRVDPRIVKKLTTVVTLQKEPAPVAMNLRRQDKNIPESGFLDFHLNTFSDRTRARYSP